LVANSYVINTAASNVFRYHEQIEALYSQLSAHSGSDEKPTWDYNLGFRVEQVANTGETNTANSKFTNAYTKFFPSAAITYHLQTNSSLKLSFSKRINRPELGQLNPFVDITDALNPHTGNPYLKPELITAYELGYSLEKSKYSVSTAGFYRDAQNTIKQFSQLLPNGAVLLAPENFGTTKTYGLESIWSWKPANMYNCNLSFTAFQQIIDGSNIASDVASKAFNWYGKWVQNVMPWEGGKIQVIGSYNSKLATPQGNRIALYSADLGFQQKLKNSNARLGVVVTDVFNTLESGYQNYTAEFSNSRRSKSDTRAVMLSFAYTFKSAFKEKLLENQFTPEF
jgi:outer membrane receptor protein involved in Fe transport